MLAPLAAKTVATVSATLVAAMTTAAASNLVAHPVVNAPAAAHVAATTTTSSVLAPLAAVKTTTSAALVAHPVPMVNAAAHVSTATTASKSFFAPLVKTTSTLVPNTVPTMDFAAGSATTTPLSFFAPFVQTIQSIRWPGAHTILGGGAINMNNAPLTLLPKNYAPEACTLFNNMKLPAVVLS